ncbi:MAG: succinate dehydrogenase assembly factor 2 [Methylococcaceae bacterium]|nr:succinate dehydrogenase assembly factor 2 [Methylococcaceae bacterium]
MELIAKLKWRCRRGTKELDFLLEGYLNRYYIKANREEQVLFVELLSLQDTQLIFFLLGNQQPESKGLIKLVKKIRNNSNIHS